MNDWRPFVYGGLASVTAECGTFPIDTTKTRLQIQGQVIDSRLTECRYRGMFHAFVRIFHEEGLFAFYSGIGPAILRQATYGTIKIGIYQSMKRMFVSDPMDETIVANVFSGVIAGIISSSIANPTDVLKVRMQAKTERLQTSMVESFRQIYKKEGLRGLWRGVVPTAQRAAIVAGVELPVYDITKKHILKSESMEDHAGTHFVASFTAGLAGAITSNPIDVVKTRLMNQRVLKTANGISSAIYTSSLDCIIRTAKTEGLMAFYKGFIPTWIRLGPWNIIFFLTFEKLKKTY